MKYLLILFTLILFGCVERQQNAARLSCVKNIQNEFGNSLIMYLPLAGNADDCSGNGNNGKVIGATACKDRFEKEGGAYKFNGINDYIVIPKFSRKLVNDFTISIWIRPAGNSRGRPYNSFIELGNVPNHTWNEAYNYPRGRFDLWDINSGSWYPESENCDLKWVNVVISYGEKAKRLYLNGNFISERPVELPLTYAGNDNLNIGAEIADDQYFCGEIDDVMIFGKCLSRDEVQKLYTQFR